MDLSEIVSIPGMPGLFKVAARRNDGLIVTSLADDKTQFVSGRTNLFSTLDNITIYFETLSNRETFGDGVTEADRDLEMDSCDGGMVIPTRDADTSAANA